MDRLKRARRPLRGQLTKTMNDSTAILDGDNADSTVLEANLEVMKTLAEDLFEKDDEIATQMLDDDVGDADQDQEYDEVMRYKKTYTIVKKRIEKFLDPPVVNTNSDDDSSVAASFVTTQSKSDNTRNFKLPRIELKKFNGDLKQWLGWWSQFKKIHEDEGMHDSDKFQYLANSMEAGSEAAELVDSYPPTANNYEKVMEALEERFGREDLLLQVYVRELLTLVISNVTSGTKIPLASLYLKLESHLRSLAALNLTSADPATWLFPLVESSLCEETLRAWQRSTLSKENGQKMVPPKTRLDLLMEFIKTEVRSEQQISLAQSGFQTKNGKALGKKRDKKEPKMDEVATVAGLTTGQAAKCAFCEKNHDTDRCVSILSTPAEERRNIIKDKKLCFQCLRYGHNSKNCRAIVKCALCGGKHYPVVCTRSGGNREGGKKDYNEQKHLQEDFRSTTVSNYPEKTAHNSNNCSGNVLLNTVWVTMVGGRKPVRVRLVGDNCSQRSYIRTSALNKIEREKVGEEWLQNIVFGGQTTKVECSGRYRVQLCHQDENKVEAFDLLEKVELCGKLPRVPYGPWIAELKERGVKLNDIGTGCDEIDILIGNDHWGKLLTSAPIVKLECGLYAQETIFGWTLGGRVPKIASNVVSTVISLACTTVDLSNLWSLEAIGITDQMERKTAEQEEIEAQSHFNQTVKQDTDGRYVVALPWKYEDVDLPVNKWQAEKRLRSSTYKLKSKGNWMDYDKVFRGWLEEGLISTVENDKDEGHYLPHRPVFKMNSSTPVRPVYDASCRLPNQMSLNDCLYKGPNLLELIPSLLLRFREKNVGVTADIRKAFQMVKVREQDKKFQKFLWWEDDKCTKVKVYMHERVVFGMNCSPFLLGATINHHLDNLDIQTDTSTRLKNSWYVDNCILSLDSVEQYHTFKEEATSIMKSAGMELRQWAHTCEQASGFLELKNNLEDSPAESNDKCLMILGLVLDREKDGLSCEIKPCELVGRMTKRKILSVASQVFDPLGMLCPATLQPKLILQQIWIKNHGWDEALPEDISTKFMDWVNEAQLLREIWIPRHFQLSQAATKEVHCFVDASILSYACVLYMRTEYLSKVRVEFLTAKTRLAPIKGSTIPRLELMACLLGTRMFNLVQCAIEMVGVKTYFWTDSTTALAWIQRDIECGVFVNNRRKEIRRSTEPNQWAHIPGIYNPADLPSRGCTPRQLLECQEWRKGPAWLSMSKDSWPISNEIPDEDEICKELRKTSVCVSLIASMDLRFSSYEKNVAVWGWIHRYKCKLRKENVGDGDLSIMELREGEKLLLYQIQRACFQDRHSRKNGQGWSIESGDKDNKPCG